MSDITHLDEIEQSLVINHFPKAKWLPFGLKLGLHMTTLEALEAKHRGDDGRCLLDCISLWLKRADGTKSKGPASWDTLANALRKMDENVVAQKITELSEITDMYGLF